MVFKVFPCFAENKKEIMQNVIDTGIVLFQDTNTTVQNFYQEHLKGELSKEVHLLYTNHKSEGYFYFLLDLDKYSSEEAKEIIRGANLIFRHN